MTKKLTVDNAVYTTFAAAQNALRDNSIVKIYGNWQGAGKLVIAKQGVIVSGFETPQLNNLEIKAPNVKAENLEVLNAKVEQWLGAVTVRKTAPGTQLLNLKVHDNPGLNMCGILLDNVSNCLIQGGSAYRNYQGGVIVISHAGQPAITGNRIRLFEAYLNTLAGAAADGFKVEGIAARNTLFEHCVAHDNGDDGFDSWNSEYTTMRYCVSYNHNGVGDGIGYKCGPGRGTLAEFCVAYNNKAAGFASNGTGVIYNNNVSHNNGTGIADNWRVAGNTDKSILTNNKVYDNAVNIAKGQYTVIAA